MRQWTLSLPQMSTPLRPVAMNLTLPRLQAPLQPFSLPSLQLRNSAAERRYGTRVREAHSDNLTLQAT